MLIDTHAHLSYPELAPQIDAVLDRAAQAGVQRIITVATEPADAADALALMHGRPQIYLAAGIHPHQAGKVGPEDIAALDRLHDDPSLRGRLLAVGETGLDFHYDFATPQRQEEVFRHQLGIAMRVHRPVIIHARKSEAQVCDILSEYPELSGRVVFHCFSATPQIARRALDLGFWLSFTGVLTFKNADDVVESARLVPRDRVMLETDSPFLSPEPKRKVRPNEPAFVRLTAEKLAEVRGESIAEVESYTTANAARFFGVPV